MGKKWHTIKPHYQCYYFWFKKYIGVCVHLQTALINKISIISSQLGGNHPEMCTGSCFIYKWTIIISKITTRYMSLSVNKSYQANTCLCQYPDLWVFNQSMTDIIHYCIMKPEHRERALSQQISDQSLWLVYNCSLKVLNWRSIPYKTFKPFINISNMYL